MQLSVSVAELQKGQSQINSTVVGIDATVTEIDERVIKMEQNGKIIHNLFPVMEIEPQEVSALPLYNNSNHLTSFLKFKLIY